MKNYFTIAAVLGVIAFASVSFLAQADQQPAGAVIAKNTADSGADSASDNASDSASDPSDGEAAADKAASQADTSTQDAASDAKQQKYVKDDDDCAAKAEAPDKTGASPTDDQKNTSYRKCMQMHGHSAAEMKKNGVDLSNTTGPGKDAQDQGNPTDE